MAGDMLLTLNLDASLAKALQQAAGERDWTPESLAIDCLRQHFEIALRHRVLIERIEAVDAALMQMADAVAELAQPSESAGIDLSQVCRFSP